MPTRQIHITSTYIHVQKYSLHTEGLKPKRNKAVSQEKSKEANQGLNQGKIRA